MIVIHHDVSWTDVCKEAFYEKPLILADRDMVETESDEILANADREDVSLLVVGDPFGCVTVFFFGSKLTPDLVGQQRTPTSSFALGPWVSPPVSSTMHR